MNESDELVEQRDSHGSKLFRCYLHQSKVPSPLVNGKNSPIDFFDLGTKKEKERNGSNIIRLWDYYMACLGNTQILKLLKLLKGKIRYLTFTNIKYLTTLPLTLPLGTYLTDFIARLTERKAGGSSLGVRQTKTFNIWN